MRKNGTVVRFDTARGFGFIRSHDSKADVFFHLRDCRDAQATRAGGNVTFEEIHVGGKGPRAMSVQVAGPALPPADSQMRDRTSARPPRKPSAAVARPPTRRRTSAVSGPKPGRTALLWWLALVWLGLLAWGVRGGSLPHASVWVVSVLNILTFLAYWFDKSAARQGSWRTPESQLLLLGLAGGWPAAGLAQHWLRHKSSKASFLAAYWVTVAVNLGALAFWIWKPLAMPGL
jgi:uncharacterized membrane protein YsdA (DUF1294 family)/cold shock CspA family protein